MQATAVGVFLRHCHQHEAGPRLVVGSALGRHVTEHLTGLSSPHLHCDILRGLVMERIHAVKTEHHVISEDVFGAVDDILFL